MIDDASIPHLTICCGDRGVSAAACGPGVPHTPRPEDETTGDTGVSALRHHIVRLQQLQACNSGPSCVCTKAQRVS